MSGKVQNASTHTLQSRVSTRTQQSVSSRDTQFNGALERYTWVRFARKLTFCRRQCTEQQSAFQGAMDEWSGQGRKAAHIDSCVAMDIRAFKVGLPKADKDASALQAKKAEHVTFHQGDG